jgi:hypothetical protein
MKSLIGASIKNAFESEMNIGRFKELDRQDKRLMERIIQMDMTEFLNQEQDNSPERKDTGGNLLTHDNSKQTLMLGNSARNTAASSKNVGREVQKEMVITKIAQTLYKTEYTYLEYLDHIVCGCKDFSKTIIGCPLGKCRSNSKMNLSELREHLKNDCNKIKMQCDTCEDYMKRPRIIIHDCITVF